MDSSLLEPGSGRLMVTVILCTIGLVSTLGYLLVRFIDKHIKPRKSYMSLSTPQHKQRTPTPGENDLMYDRTGMPERRAEPDQNARTIAGIKAAITSYYLDLDARKHGGVAQDHAFSKIEQMLGMSWSQHQADMAKAKESK